MTNESTGELSHAELQRSRLSLVDEIGTVFFWRDRVLRAIRPEAEEGVRGLLASGLPDALAERGWMPRCRVADVRIEGFACVVEQPRLPVVSYPYEWSYGMLRDAAVRVLEIAMLAKEHRWELKDSHGFNVIFDGPRPAWVDLGSFAPRSAEARGWLGLEEFVRFYEYPLWIWSHGGAFVARRLVAARELMGHADYGLYRWPWWRLGGAALYERWAQRWYKLRRFSRIPDEKFRQRLPRPAANLLCCLKARGWLPGQEVSLERRRRRLLGLTRRAAASPWGDYQGAGPDSVATPRFQRIGDLLRQSEMRSVLELGGNQGWFSERLLREGVVQSATCTDADELAIDRGYERTKAAGGRLHLAVLNFISPVIFPGSEPPEARFRSDAVLVLAVTHHLLLTQRIPIEHMLRVIAGYARRMVFVEFMPLGLWDGHQAPPVPGWYTAEWFRDAFARQFEWVHDERLEPNRWLFCGRVRPDESVASE